MQSYNIFFTCGIVVPPICDTIEATPYMLPKGEYTLAKNSQLIQKGNGAYALRTSTIYVGSALVPGVVTKSAQAYGQLYQRMKKARQRGHEIVLVIEELSKKTE